MTPARGRRVEMRVRINAKVLTKLTMTILNKPHNQIFRILTTKEIYYLKVPAGKINFIK